MTGRSLLIFTFLSLISLPFYKVMAQENPPIPIEVEVRNAQGLNFGTFTVGNAGGDVIISPNGDRIGDNSVQLLNMGSTSHYAIFDVYAIPGTLLQIKPVQNVPLSGPSARNVTLSIDPYRDISTGQTFITKTNPQEVIVGGKLSISNGSADPAGNYSANFELEFIHE